MLKVLVFVGLGLLSAGIASAQQPQNDLAQMIIDTVIKSQTCSSETFKVPLAHDGWPESAWQKPDGDDRDALQQLATGNERYRRPLGYLDGEVTYFDGQSDVRRVEARLTQEVPYGIVFRLYNLTIVLDQVLREGEWWPIATDFTIQYWKGLGFNWLGVDRYDRYRTILDCAPDDD